MGITSNHKHAKKENLHLAHRAEMQCEAPDVVSNYFLFTETVLLLML